MASGRKARNDGKRRATPPGSGGRRGGWGQTHSEVFLLVQRKLGAPRRRAWTGDRSIPRLCSWIVLVAEVDERHFGPSQLPRRVTAEESVGSSLPASRLVRVLGGERVSEAGSRRQSREYGGRLSMILCLRAIAHAKARRRLGGGASSRGGGASRSRSLQGREHSSREGALASPKRSSLTRRLWRRCLAVHWEGSAERPDLPSEPRQRASEATSQARLAVENAAAGRCSA